MSLKIKFFKDISQKTPCRYYFITLKDNVYRFNVRWNAYGDYPSLDIYNDNNELIKGGLALINNLFIRSNKLPFSLFFTNNNGDSYEPTIDTFSTDFVLIFEDNNE